MESPQGQVVSVADSRLRLRSRLGVLTLLLLCAVQFLDIVDTSIVNVALPSIQRNLHFSQQNLQWVASGYILTYGDSSCWGVVSPICSGGDGCSSSVWPCSGCHH